VPQGTVPPAAVPFEASAAALAAVRPPVLCFPAELVRPVGTLNLSLDEARPALVCEGREWIEWRRRSWSEGDPWFDLGRLDFSRPSLNPGGWPLDPLALARLQELVASHNRGVRAAAADYWAAVGLAWDEAFAAGLVRLRRDPLGGDDLVLYWDSAPPEGVLVEVHALAGGWLAELTLSADQYPELAGLFAQLQELERARLLAVRDVLEGSRSEGDR
jgi:hypothetical protein